MTNKKTFLLVSACLLVFLFLRFLFLFFFNSFTFDEMVSLKVAEQPLGQIWDYLQWEMHPPLHFYFLHFWIKLFGTGAIVVRLSSLALSFFTAIAIYFLGKEIFNSKKSGFFIALLFSISPFLSFYSVWSRMYMMLFLFSSLSFYFFLKIIKGKTAESKFKKIYFVLYLLSTVFALYSHITALLILFIQFIYIVTLLYSNRLKSKNIFINFLSFFVLSFALYLPWFLHFVLIRLKTLNIGAWYFYDTPNSLLFFNNPLKFFVSESSLITNNIGLLLIFVLFILAFIKIEKNKQKEITIKLNKTDNLFFPVFIFVISLVSLAFFGLYALRYYMIPCLGFLLIIGNSLAQNNLNKKAKAILIGALLLVMVPSFFSVSRNLSYYKMESATSFIEANEKPGDKIITSFYKGLLSLDHYYKGSLEANSIIDASKKEKDMLLTTIKTNYYSTINKENINQLAELVPRNGKIFFVFTDNDYDTIDLALNWFLKNNWVKTGQFAGDSYHDRAWILEKK